MYNQPGHLPESAIADRTSRPGSDMFALANLLIGQSFLAGWQLLNLSDIWWCPQAGGWSVAVCFSPATANINMTRNVAFLSE